MRDQVATLILAGHETTAVALFWALVLLAQAPDEQRWLAEEAGSVRLDAETAFSALPNLPRARSGHRPVLHDDDARRPVDGGGHCCRKIGHDAQRYARSVSQASPPARWRRKTVLSHAAGKWPRAV